MKSNRTAVGARIAVTITDSRGERRSIHRTVSTGGSFGASPLQQHVGLGQSATIESVEVWWPASGTRQRFTGVRKNRLLRIEELADRYTTLERPRVTLGGSAGRP